MDKSGKMHKGLLELNGRKYYSGWNGVLAMNRWVTVNGRWYWADVKGELK